MCATQMSWAMGLFLVQPAPLFVTDEPSLTPSLPQPVKLLGRKVHAYMPADSLHDGPITNLFSRLCVLIDVLSYAHEEGEKP